jgi:diacylglycerol kinase family enzyme
MPDLVGPQAEPLGVRFAGPDGAIRSAAHVILVSNDPYHLHMAAGRGTRERLDRGLLGIVALHIGSGRDLARLVALEATGRGARFGGWLEWAAAEFRIDSDRPVEVGLDGEALVLEPPLLFESRAGALRVRLPRRAVGLSPTALAPHVLSGPTISRLVRLAAGRAA